VEPLPIESKILSNQIILSHFHHRSSRLRIGLTMLSAIGSIDLMRSARRSCTRWGMRPISYAQSGAGLSKKNSLNDTSCR
jgi:hypothetical protein